MKAAWDLPWGTDQQDRELIKFVSKLGFDTLVINDPTELMVEYGHDLGVRLVDIVDARPTDAFCEAHPECLQSVHSIEESMSENIEAGQDDYQQLAHRWFPLIHGGPFLCFEHERSLQFLENQVSKALATADGVAFDGFGFRNHYACFCDRCVERREKQATVTDTHEFEVFHQVAEMQLVEASRRLYDKAKSVASDSLVMNHVWPPFNPNPYYGHQLRLDYCTQTISWFYRPAWSVERVEFEAAEHARLESDANTFVPFIGMSNDPYQRRSPQRLARELDIATKYGDGNLVLCTLGVPYEHPDHAQVVKDALT